MTVLSKMIETDAQVMRENGYSVQWSANKATVAIEHAESPEKAIFMQGDEASDFIDEIDRVVYVDQDTAEMSEVDIALHLARDYVDTTGR